MVQTTLPGFLIHADAIVTHFDLNLPMRIPIFVRNGMGDQNDGAPFGRASTALKNQVDQRFPEFRRVAQQQWQ